MTFGRRAAAAASVAILVAIGLGTVLLALSMLRYPGGTAMDATSIGHSFWSNFLCDLTSDLALNGRSNHVGSLLARAALASFCFALTCFWLLLPASFDHRCHPASALAMRILGITSVVGLLVVPVATGWSHVVAVFASSVPALLAGVLGLLGTLRYSRATPFALAAGATISASAIDAVLYARSYLVHPRVVVPALPLFQRLAMILMLAWMAMVAARALWPWSRSRSADRTPSVDRAV